MPNENDPVTITQTTPDGQESQFEVAAATTEEQSLAGQIVEALLDDDAPEAEVTFADTDGDGKIDAGAADTDGDGQLDTVVGDTDGDGVIDAASADTDGDGQLDVIAMDTDGDGEVDAIGEDTDGDGQIDTAYFDTDGDGEYDTEVLDSDGDGQADSVVSMTEGLPSEEEISTNSVEFTVGEDGFPISEETATDEYVAEVEEASTDNYSTETPAYETSAPAESEVTSTEPVAVAETDSSAEQPLHADAARDAQAAAYQYVEQGDYAAAAEARELAEEEAWAAGDNSMLSGSDAAELEHAGYKQELAEDYRTQQAEHIAAGDYEAAREDALNAAYQTGDADFLASGSDHTGQSDQDAYNLGNAVSEEKNAEYFANNAEWYAEQGNTAAAESSAQNAAEYQASADNYADTANPASPNYDVDPSSAGGGYDMAAVDTGFESTVDTTTPTTYDSGSDDGTV